MNSFPPKHSPSDDRGKVVYGIHPVEELLQSGKNVERIFIQRDLKKETAASIFRMAKESDIPVLSVPKEKLNRVAGTNHQGVAAIISQIQFFKFDDVLSQVYEKGEVPLFIICERITDVRNFGAIARTGLCGGSHAIIVPHSETASINAEAIKASAGALNKIAVCREKNLVNTMKQLKLNGIQTLAADAKGSKFIFDCDLKIPTTFIMGSEGAGIDSALLRLVDEIVKLPMTGDFDSYNVSVAAGMILYEVMRQRMK